MKMKRGKVVVFNIFCFICSLYKEITGVARASWVTLSSTPLFHLQNYRTRVLPSSGVRSPESNLSVRTTKDSSPNFAYLVLRNGLCLVQPLLRSCAGWVLRLLSNRSRGTLMAHVTVTWRRCCIRSDKISPFDADQRNPQKERKTSK